MGRSGLGGLGGLGGRVVCGDLGGWSFRVLGKEGGICGGGIWMGKVWWVVLQRQSGEVVQNFLDSLPPSVRDSVQSLRNLQKKCDDMKMDFMKEKRLLEEKYRELYGEYRIGYQCAMNALLRNVWGGRYCVHVCMYVCMYASMHMYHWSCAEIVSLWVVVNTAPVFRERAQIIAGDTKENGQTGGPGRPMSCVYPGTLVLKLWKLVQVSVLLLDGAELHLSVGSLSQIMCLLSQD